MSRYWRSGVITASVLFLEGCALYLAFAAISAVTQAPAVKLPFWLVLLALVWGFALSSYLLTVKVTPRIRGLIGLAAGIPSILVLAAFNTGLGLIPAGALSWGGLETALVFGASVLFLLAVWWRAVEVSRDEASLETVRSAFLIGLIVLFVAVVVDSLSPVAVVNGFLVVGYFAVGLASLALARFSFESGDGTGMSTDWFIAVFVSVGGVLALALAVSAAGVGGLGDLTRQLVSAIGEAGLWLLKPVFLLLGVFASALVTIGNWLSGFFGGGNLDGLVEAQQRLAEFHQSLQEEAQDGGPPVALLTALKWLAFFVTATVAAWLLYKLFRARRFLARSGAVTETRESSFSWKQVNDDVTGFLGDWWANLWAVRPGTGRRRGEPGNPREFYHGLLRLAERVGQPREEWQTPREHQRTLVGLLPADPVGRIVDDFQAYHYGNWELEPGVVERLSEAWRELNTFLREQQAAS